MNGPVIRLTRPSDDLISLFARHAAETGMVVHTTTVIEAIGCVRSIVSTIGARRVAVSDIARLQDIKAALQTDPLELIASSSGFEPLYAADAGITDVQAAIAETGSLVCSSGAGRSRGLSLVPPVHIAIVRRSDIVPDLLDFFTQDSSARRGHPSNIVLITGPSKTADIEGILITGVHGPRQVHIVLVEDA